MLPRNRNILKPNFALVSSSYFHRNSLGGRYHMHTTLFFWLLPLIDSLQNHVRTIWPFDGNHLKLKLVFHDHSGKGKLANLALKFIKVVCFDNPDDLFFDFAVNPSLETLDMNKAAVSFTLARRNKEIVIFVLLSKTYFAGALHFLSSLKNSIKLAQKDVFEDLLVFALRQASNLNNFKLDSPDFYDIPGFWHYTIFT